MMLRDVVEVYRGERSRARRRSSFLLRRQERESLAVARRRRLTAAELARLAAVRDELCARGVDVLLIEPGSR